MSADRLSLESTSEWNILKTLCLSHHRLIQTKKYEPLDEVEELDQAIDNELRNQQELFENGMRSLLTRRDIYELVHDGLDHDAMQDAYDHLQILCDTMNMIVDRDPFCPPTPHIGELPSDRKYPNLTALIEKLLSTNFKFELATGLGPKLFKLESVDIAKMAKKNVDQVNNFFTALTQPQISNLRSGSEYPASYKLGTSQGENDLIEALHGLSTLVSTLDTQLHCDKEHDVLLQLPHWNISESERWLPKKSLDLFLSICEVPSCWQESILNTLPPSVTEGNQWECSRDLCEKIHKTYNGGGGLRLGFLKEDVYIFRGNMHSMNIIPRSFPHTQPAKTLQKLLRDRAFHPPRHHTPGYRIRFDHEEKRALAARLVSSLAFSLASGQRIECWDASNIYFLTKHKDDCLRNLPYALFRIKKESRNDDQWGLQKFDHIMADKAFPCLAWLLFEIECGMELDRILKGHARDGKRGKEKLEKEIAEARGKDLWKDPFLDAVQACLDFQATYKKHTREMSRRMRIAEQDARTTALMITASDIIKLIHQKSDPDGDFKQIQPIHQKSKPDGDFKRRRSESMNSERDISRNLAGWRKNDEMGRRSGEALYDYSFVHPIEGLLDDTNAKHDKERSRKKVKWMDDEDKDGCEYSTSSRQSKTASMPETVRGGEEMHALFGKDHKEHQHDRHCQVAEKWVTGFKILVRRFNIGRGPAKRLSVAILDTGCDMSHPDFEKETRILKQNSKSWTGGDPGIDPDGHGTHIAGIVLKLTKNVDLYIGQVLDSRLSQERKRIVEALVQARTVWKVDMISLSFGFANYDTPDEIRTEIQRCLNDGIMVFASASNDGGNGVRTYPAKYDRVMCIHSATGQGRSSSFNPSPMNEKMKKDNFSVLGECISSSWPVKQSESLENNKKCKSGTSFAVPVAVSIAAFLLGYIRKEMSDHEWNINPSSPEGINLIFRLMAEERDGYDWVSPERYFAVYGNDIEKVKADLRFHLEGRCTASNI